ncbi:MAG: asparagine synthase (glutamine-hydrolyzing) [Ardenticatenaceae bacterium]|nr:asparagine synthase (glutamine-hydrolyzing) [Anaerolineales bacterium]MCB8937495.1 asparagine synthase (glutamine-hydrolyzing) [Ardenticatenaceae bacterium]MCB8975524.1 asparagine synthase (glutamine-hydrolyzing) [Ardenticatenaceae bacterium]
MCGITGILTPQINRERLEKANDLLHHRGPDDAGIFIADGIGLAARRLSIIDLAHGHQPLSNEDGTIWITYNGEVMNAPALRTQLEAAGHQFRTRTDTETIVHAYEEWGTDAFVRLRGMFAFALWDGRSQTLILVRDRFGIKPLYYAKVGNELAVASEIRPIFHLLPTLSRRTNRQALTDLFTMGFVPTPQTMFADVYKLPAAHMLIAQNGQMTIRPYHQLIFPDHPNYHQINEADAVDEFMAHLRDAVAAWRLSDVPVGSLLSGGIDSSALATLLTELSGQPIHTFNIAFSAASHDESAYAQAVAQRIGSQHHTLHFGPEAFDLLPQIVAQLEEPQCSATSLPIYLLYQACREAGFKVILTGEGADELLGGYHWFDGDRRIRPFLHIPQPIRQLLSHLPLPGSTAGQRVLTHATRDPLTRFALWHQVASPQILKSLFGHREHRDFRENLSFSSVPSVANYHPLNQFLALEAQTRMVDFINFEVDRMSMANSVEARPPFLDHKLWEFCATLPPEFKLNAAMNKVLLRRGMKNLLPTAVTHRAKQGLATPHAAWWRSQKLPAWVEECLQPTSLRETGYFNVEMVENLREAHRNGRTDHSRILTGILTTQLWHQAMEIRD